VAGSRFQVHTVGITVETLGEDHAVEGPVELDVHPHVGLLALHLQVLDLRTVVGAGQGPGLLGHIVGGSGAQGTLGRSVNGCGWTIAGPVFEGQGGGLDVRGIAMH